jgi:hypothetical protein
MGVTCVAQLERERRRAEEKERELAAIVLRHDNHVENIKAEISAKLPGECVEWQPCLGG